MAISSYAGVGSRSTPDDIQQEMDVIARMLAVVGARLRSGGADGADKAFQFGAMAVNGKAEIYLPWDNFNGFKVDNHNYFLANPEVDHIATSLVNRFHPAPNKLSPGALRLHKRNCHQVLGWNLEDPVNFVLFYGTNVQYDSRMLAYDCDGGTKTAVRIASSLGIPCYNLGNRDVLAYVKKKLKLI